MSEGKKPKKVDVRVSLGRLMGGDGGGCFELKVEDVVAGHRFLTIRLNNEQFADLLSNRLAGCVAEVRGLDLVGTKREVKTELVKFERFTLTGAGGLDEKRKAVATFEVDGWRADLGDLTNGHRSAGDGRQRVHFTRNVPITESHP